MTATSATPLLVVQPSDDYAGRVRRHVGDAVMLATPERAALLVDHPRVVAADLDDADAAAAAARCYAWEHRMPWKGIVCFVCDYLPLTARLARQLGLPFHGEGTVARTRHKDLTAAAWQAAGVPTPPTRRVHRLAELLDFAATVPAPWVLKPTDRSGSEWVLRVDRERDLPLAHQRIKGGLASEGNTDSEGISYLAQAFVRGREFGADIYVEGGRVRILRLTEKCMQPEPELAGVVGAYYPARLDAPAMSCLQETFRQGAQALGIERGIAMVDVILAGSSPYLLEMALRPGGDCLPDLCRRGLGYDPIRAACQVALGARPDMSGLHAPEPLAAVHLMTTQTGLVRRIDCRELLAHPRVVELIEIYHHPGEFVRRWEGSYDDRILASCLVHCPDPAELPQLIPALSGLLDLDLDDAAEADPLREASFG